MILRLEADRAIIGFGPDDSRILSYGSDGKCFEIDIALDDFEDLCLQYTTIIKSVLKAIRNNNAVLEDMKNDKKDN